MNAEQTLKGLLRLTGSSSLLALIFVAAPYSWMDSIHAMLGMGPLPAQPVVGYLARSTSALYALLGGLFWVLSLDPTRYRPLLLYLAAALTLLGLVLLVVDWSEGMPAFWTLWEGPLVTVIGLALFFLSRRLRTRSGI